MRLDKQQRGQASEPSTLNTASPASTPRLHQLSEGEEERDRVQLCLPLRLPGTLTDVCSGDRLAGAERGPMI